MYVQYVCTPGKLKSQLGDDGNRTRDLRDTINACQLSYVVKSVRVDNIPELNRIDHVAHAVGRALD